MGKRFALADVVTIVSGRLVTDIGNVYKICNYLTGCNLYTHQLSRASRVCKEYLLKENPELGYFLAESELKDLDDRLKVCNTEDERRAVCDWWVNRYDHEYGSFIELEPMPAGTYEEKDPLAELVEMRRNNYH